MEENKMQELEEMRQQLSILQSKLDKQDIINDELMNKSMRNKMSWIKKYIISEIIAVPILAVVFACIYTYFNISFASYVFLIIMLVADVYIDYIVNVSALKPSDYEKYNLIQTVEKLIKMKKIRSQQTFAGILIIIVWGTWFGYGLYNTIPLNDNAFYKGAVNGGLIGLIIGGIVGMIIGYSIYRKMQKTNDELINQIKEITDK